MPSTSLPTSTRLAELRILAEVGYTTTIISLSLGRRLREAMAAPVEVGTILEAGDQI